MLRDGNRRIAEATFRDELAPANPDQALRHQTVYPVWMPGERDPCTLWTALLSPHNSRSVDAGHYTRDRTRIIVQHA